MITLPVGQSPAPVTGAGATPELGFAQLIAAIVGGTDVVSPEVIPATEPAAAVEPLQQLPVRSLPAIQLATAQNASAAVTVKVEDLEATPDEPVTAASFSVEPLGHQSNDGVPFDFHGREGPVGPDSAPMAASVATAPAILAVPPPQLVPTVDAPDDPSAISEPLEVGTSHRLFEMPPTTDGAGPTGASPRSFGTGASEAAGVKGLPPASDVAGREQDQLEVDRSQADHVGRPDREISAGMAALTDSPRPTPAAVNAHAVGPVGTRPGSPENIGAGPVKASFSSSPEMGETTDPIVTGHTRKVDDDQSREVRPEVAARAPAEAVPVVRTGLDESVSETRRPTTALSSAAARLEAVVRRLESAPPPNVVTLSIEELNIRVTVAIRPDGVQLWSPTANQEAATLIRSLEEALAARGFDLSGRQARRQHDEPPETAPVTTDSNRPRPKKGLRL